MAERKRTTSMQNTTQKTKDGARRTSQKPARYLTRHCSGYNAFTLFRNLHVTHNGHWSGSPYYNKMTPRREGTAIHHTGTRCRLSHGNRYQYLVSPHRWRNS
jgi:hypothetical protein